MDVLSFVFTLFVFIFFDNVSANKNLYYCDFGFCEVDQYCCGDNKCCYKLLDLWYLWIGLGIVITVVIAVLFFKYYLWKRKPKYPKYQLLEQT